jgi:nicotinate-nucleotide adenylyltransferase
VLVPARIPPHKTAELDPGALERLAMCRLAVDGEPGLSACSLEIDRPGPSFTVDTLKAIHAIEPDAELTFIVGADIARTLASWREPAEVLELARLAVAERSGASREQVLSTVAEVARSGGAAGRSARHGAQVVFIEMPPVEVSSSMVRERAALGEPLEPLVGAAVARHIYARGLYRAGAGGER